MKILYVGHTRFPTEKAHGRQIAEVCGAMAGLGHAVTLVTPGVRTPITETPFTYYGIPQNFSWKRTESFDALHHPFIPQFLAFMIGIHSFRRTLRSFLSGNQFDLLYCRSHVVLPVLLASKIPTIIELHTLPHSGKRSFVNLCNRCARVVCLTTPMRDELVSLGVHADHIVVEGDAVRFSELRSVPPLTELKERFVSSPVIGYVGSLVARNSLEKGVGELIRAFAIMKGWGISFRGLIVGGPDSWKKRYEEDAGRLGLSGDIIIFTGHVPASSVSSFLQKCDLLVYPAPASRHPYFLRDTSPLKIFEYMAAGKPIVTADLPPIHDVLDSTTATFFRPGDPKDLAESIRRVLAEPDVSHAKAARARARVEQHTWERRMERILATVPHS